MTATHAAPKSRTPKAKPPAPPREEALVPSAEDFLVMISRLAADPNVSAEKIKMLFDLNATAEANRARRAFDVAMHGLQTDLPVIAEHGKSATGTYAKYEDVIEAVRPVALKHGFTLRHHVAAAERGVKVVAILAHVGGHREENALPLPVDLSDGKAAIHGAASSISYGKRITTNAILGIVTRGEDDDAKKAAKPDTQEAETLSQDQQRELLALISCAADLDFILKETGAADLPGVLAKDFLPLKMTLKAKAKAKAKKDAAQ